MVYWHHPQTVTLRCMATQRRLRSSNSVRTIRRRSMMKCNSFLTPLTYLGVETKVGYFTSATLGRSLTALFVSPEMSSFTLLA